MNQLKKEQSRKSILIQDKIRVHQDQVKAEEVMKENNKLKIEKRQKRIQELAEMEVQKKNALIHERGRQNVEYYLINKQKLAGIL